MLREFCKLQETNWLAELRAGTFSKVDLFYVIDIEVTDAGIDFADPAIHDDPVRMNKVVDSLAGKGQWSYCRLVARYNPEGGRQGIFYDHEELE